jgi:hypothetical protein
MILVSYSLYGSDPKYLIGAVKNAALIQELGPDWQAVFYLAPEIPNEIESELVKFGAVVKRWESNWHQNGMFWRFSVIKDFEFDFAIIRDVDSRISERELNCLNKWFDSGKILSVIRDHPHHNALILGGLWGVSSKVKQSSINWKNSELFGMDHGQDQVFLKKEVYPILKKSMYLNDAFFSYPRSKYRFPSIRNGLEFIGESVNENEEFDANLRQVLQTYLNSRSKRLLILVRFYLHKIP